MKTNISALMNLIAQEEKNLNNKSYSLVTYAKNTSVVELDDRVNIIEDFKEEFDLNFAEVERITKELSNLKTILYTKNNEFKLSDGRTIQQAIIDNTYLRKLKTTYEQLLVFQNSKKRVTEVNNSYFECKTVNFNSNEIRTKIEKIDTPIQKTDFEISNLNSIEFEI